MSILGCSSIDMNKLVVQLCIHLLTLDVVTILENLALRKPLTFMVLRVLGESLGHIPTPALAKKHRLGTVNSKPFIGKFLLKIKWNLN